MRKLLLSVLLVPFFASAASVYWFERVNADLSTTQGISNTSYRPGTLTDSVFNFDRNGKKISVWVNFKEGNDAVYAFDSMEGKQLAVVVNNGQLEIKEGAMMDLMASLHKRGNMTAANLNRTATVSADKKQVELKSSIQNSQGALTVIKIKKINDYPQDIHLSFSVTGVDSAAELEGILSIIRPIVERQIEF